MLEQFEQISKQAVADLKNVRDLKDLEDFRIKYLGRKGLVTQMLSQIGKVPKEERSSAGQLANKIKKDWDSLSQSLKVQ